MYGSLAERVLRGDEKGAEKETLVGLEDLRGDPHASEKAKNLREMCGGV